MPRRRHQSAALPTQLGVDVVKLLLRPSVLGVLLACVALDLAQALAGGAAGGHRARDLHVVHEEAEKRLLVALAPPW